MSLFIDAFHEERKIVPQRNLSYSHDENGAGLWIAKLKQSANIKWDEWAKKHGGEQYLVEAKQKEFTRCNRILEAFILDAETSHNHRVASKAIMTALFSTYYPL